MSVGFKPIDVYKAGANEERGEMARMTALAGVFATADLVKTTLGPKGMDKILQGLRGGADSEVQVTNDGATILKSVHINNPAAKLMVDISKSQDDEVGDGTTSVVVLAGEILREGEKLLAQKVHPQIIIAGWRRACNAARLALQASAVNNAADEKRFEADLMNIARTTLSSKILLHDKDQFARLAVDAILRVGKKHGLEAIQIIKKQGGLLRDSYLEQGFILQKRFGVGQSKKIENCKILICNAAMDTDKIKIWGGQAKSDSLLKLGEIEEAERRKMLDKCDKIAAYGCNVFCNRQLVYYMPEQYLADKGIHVVELCDFSGVEALVKVCGGELMSTFEEPEKGPQVMGTCASIEEIMIGEDTVLRFNGCGKMEACTIVLRGSSQHVLDEAERSLHDALCVLHTAVRDSRVTLGGGCAEMLMAKAVDDAAATVTGKEMLAMEAYARALRRLPGIIADNAGFDAADLTAQLKAAHNSGNSKAGLDMRNGTIGQMDQLGITEPFRVKEQVLTAASEASEMIMRIDDVLSAAPRQRRPMRH